MASLNTTLTRRQIFANEENLDRDRVWTYQAGNEITAFPYGAVWYGPGCGKATVEMWGAGGSGALMCCCGAGLPGNPGAYVKKTICVTPSTIVCSFPGFACGNSSGLCYRGSSEPSQLCWLGATDRTGITNGCMCAQGGNGGYSYCTTGPAGIYCCFRAGGFLGTQTQHGAGCGIICNTSANALAYGGDVNCCGGYSCVNWQHCDTIYTACGLAQLAVRTPAGFYGQGPTNLFFSHGANTAADSRLSRWSGQGIHNYIYAINSASRFPTQGYPWTSCWVSTMACGCYEASGCYPYLPPGFPGIGPTPCPGVRSHAYRGGHGAVRIKYVCCDSCFYDCTTI